MHQILMGNVAVGENDNVHTVIRNQTFEIFLFENRDPIGVQAPGQGRGITAPRDIRDLSGGKSNHLVVEILTKNNVEVVKVAACGSEY